MLVLSTHRIVPVVFHRFPGDSWFLWSFRKGSPSSRVGKLLAVTLLNQTQIRRRRWRWIGHVLRLPTDAIARVALRWTPQGSRNVGRPAETWRRTVEAEMKQQGWSWSFLEHTARDRVEWRSLVEALCAPGHRNDG